MGKKIKIEYSNGKEKKKNKIEIKMKRTLKSLNNFICTYFLRTVFIIKYTSRKFYSLVNKVGGGERRKKK